MPTSTAFAPNSFFFTDPAAITQVAGQAFGPVSADEFQITSKFTVSGSGAMAYAICTGVVFIQPQSDGNRVNLILRPYTQPALGLNIKYFIYRGLKLSDFFAADKVIGATGTTSDFINSINDAFVSFHNATDPGSSLPDFLAKYIGFDPANQPDTLPISNFFFKQSEYTTSGSTSTETDATAFDLPMVTAGASLGNFAAGECGIDVVLNYGDYALPTPNDEFVFDLAYARTDEYTIDTSDVTGDFQVKVLREQIVQFLDVAAYYGFHYCDNGVVMLNNAGTKTSKTGDAIYTEVIQNFYTKNKLYLYIQSDRTRSYNFYGNYLIDEAGTNSLKLGHTDDALTAIDFNTNSWPLLIDDATQDHSNTRNTLFLQLVTDNNNNTMLYGQVAQIDNAEGNNFCGPDDLRLPVDDDGNPSIYTKVIALSNPAAGPDGAKVNVANFNILIYQGAVYNYIAGQETDDTGATVNILEAADFFDDVFDIITATPIIKGNLNTSYTILSSLRCNVINHFVNKAQYGVSVVNTVIINDEIETGIDGEPAVERVIYATEAIDVLTTTTSVTNALTSSTIASPSVMGAVESTNTYSLPDPFYYVLISFTDDGQVINGVQIMAKDNTAPNKIILGLTKEENDSIKALITDQLHNPRLFLIDLFEDGNDLTSPENVTYQKYQIALVAEDADELKMYLPDDDVFVYSIDRNYHFSKNYSQYMQSLVYTTPYIIVNPTL